MGKKQSDPFGSAKVPVPNDKGIEKKLFGSDKTMGEMPDINKNLTKHKKDRPF